MEDVTARVSLTRKGCGFWD